MLVAFSEGSLTAKRPFNASWPAAVHSALDDERQVRIGNLMPQQLLQLLDLVL